MLEMLAGKCTSLSVAVTVAALYTDHMYKKIASFQRTGGRHRSTAISIPKNSGLMFEMERWLEGSQRLQWCVVVPSRAQNGYLDGRVRRII